MRLAGNGSSLYLLRLFFSCEVVKDLHPLQPSASSVGPIATPHRIGGAHRISCGFEQVTRGRPLLVLHLVTISITLWLMV